MTNRFVKIIKIFAIMFALLSSSVWGGIAGSVTRELIEETVEHLAKRSGKKVLESASKKTACETLERLVKTYGDNVLTVVDDAGFKLLEAVPHYGDEVIQLAAKASSQGRRAFAQNIPELLPAVRRVGMDILELEAKAPGLAIRAFNTIGDDAARAVARNIPAEDVPRILRYAEKADSPSTKKLLLETYEKEGKLLFERIPAKLVLASGLSASMLYGTHQLTNPARAIGNAIDNNFEVADKAVGRFMGWGSMIILFVIVLLFWRFELMPWQRPEKRKKKKTEVASNDLRKNTVINSNDPSNENFKPIDGDPTEPQKCICCGHEERIDC
jgi:hypothetical protein